MDTARVRSLYYSTYTLVVHVYKDLYKGGDNEDFEIITYLICGHKCGWNEGIQYLDFVYRCLCKMH